MDGERGRCTPVGPAVGRVGLRRRGPGGARRRRTDPAAHPGGAAGRLVRRIAARHPPDPGRVAGTEVGPVQHDHVLDRALEERPVVADHHQRARPRIEQVLEGAERVEVEVVGRLVQQQDVRALAEDEGELQPAPLPTRQQAHRRPLHVRAEPQALQQRGVGPVGPPGGPGHQLAHAGVGRQVDPPLVVVADPHGRTHPAPCRTGAGAARPAGRAASTCRCRSRPRPRAARPAPARGRGARTAGRRRSRR